MNQRTPAAEIYSTAILEEAPRVLSLMDRESLSPTAGCCDRTYWAWKFVDFPGARFQESLCVLSFLYSTKLEHNPYFGNQKLLEWIGCGLRFWSSIQHHDGSFDEAYPNERSLAATAFTTFYVGEALGFVATDLPPQTLRIARDTMFRAGQWLTRNDESHGFLSNHLAAAAAAVSHVYRLTGDHLFDDRSRYFLQRIMNHQSREGWYEEYGGADPGYQTHGSFYLARCWQLSQRDDLAESLGRSMSFLAHFVHPDGSLGGEYASRNTQTYYPAAFEIFAPRHSAAAWIAETMRPSVTSGAAAGLRCVDAYNYFPFLNNLVFAYLACADPSRVAATPEAPSPEPGLVWFPEAGLARVRRGRYDAYVGSSKGGVIKVFDRSLGKLVFSDCGYLGRLGGGRLASTQYQDHARRVSVRPDRIEVHGVFSEMSRPKMTPHRFLFFRLFTLSLGRFGGLGKRLKRYMVDLLIYRRRALNLGFKRTIEFEESVVRISDNLSGPDAGRLESLRWGAQFTTIHMGSSRYFITNELNETAAAQAPAFNEIDPKEVVSGLMVQRVCSFPEDA